MATVTVQGLLEAGVHFGHQTRKWNPKMKKFVYGEKNGIYIIDVTKTIRQIYEACNFLQKIASDGGDILFVGTKRQAQEVIKEAAAKTGMFYVTERWLGGTLTNNLTIQKSIKRMRDLDEKIGSPEKSSAIKKKELAMLSRTNQKLHKNLDGIANIKKLPAALVVVDVCHEEIAVKEAVKLKIPIVALVDTNGYVDNIAYPIVANDDALKSIKIIVDVLAEAVKDASEIYKRFVEENKKNVVDEPSSSGEKSEHSKDKKPSPRKRFPRRSDSRGDAAAAKPRAKKTVKPEAEKKTNNDETKKE
jgi:small subunit ribosomal protein S2